jgi:hypothetical protein
MGIGRIAIENQISAERRLLKSSGGIQKLHVVPIFHRSNKIQTRAFISKCPDFFWTQRPPIAEIFRSGDTALQVKHGFECISLRFAGFVIGRPLRQALPFWNDESHIVELADNRRTFTKINDIQTYFDWASLPNVAEFSGKPNMFQSHSRSDGPNELVPRSANCSVGSAQHTLGGQPECQSESSNRNRGERRPNFWLNIPQQFYARDYDAFARGAIIVVGGIFIILFAAVFATRRDQQ